MSEKNFGGVTMRTPNDEQKLAIEHSGGVLLSAGAGSGKTFVLVEHIIYILDSFISSEKYISEIDFKSKLKIKLSSIVLMTFTKKAAGELALRLAERIDEEILYREEKGEEVFKWNIAKEALTAMTVSTIHGFCFKLLGQGFFTDIDPSVEIISEARATNRIEKLFNEWFEMKKAKNEVTEDSFIYSVLANQKAIIKALDAIFGNPDLRLMWKTTTAKEMCHIDMPKLLAELLDLAEVDGIFSTRISANQYSDYSDKSWYKILDDFINLTQRTKLDSEESFKIYLDFFASIKRLTGPAGKAKAQLPEVTDYFQQMKALRDFLKSHNENLFAYSQHKEGAFFSWVKVVKEIVDYIEHNYKRIPGVTFSDLEYNVLLGLDCEETLERIIKTYKYFIIDEFQDTSEVQFDILKKLTRGDYNKLFCVGDMKQAIYGFRGGELGVFRDCMNKVSKSLSMTNNYRSHSNIISFNNFLFENIFAKGMGFKGVDKHAVDVEYQTYPFTGEDANEGEIAKNKVLVKNIPLNKKGVPERLSSAEVHYLDAISTIKLIKNIQEKDSGEEICILYKNLAPTNYLIPSLIKENISFTAQVKVPMIQDPVVGLFKILLESLLEMNKPSEKEIENAMMYSQILMNSYLNYLEIEYSGDVLELTKQFHKDVKSLGTAVAFNKVLFGLKLSNSNYTNNLSLIDSICLICGDDISQAYEAVRQYGENKYSIDFQYGNHPEEITIMTAHASKGLEFDHVILGGINNNGKRLPETSYFGKFPGSFRWKLSTKQKKSFKSPMYIKEDLLTKQKDFSESKRLFYVASTRAKKKLYWNDFSSEAAPIDLNAENWINGIRSWENDIEDKSEKIRLHINDKTKDESEDKIEDERELMALSNKPPLFHSDNIGLEEKVENNKSLGRTLGTLAELSVTRLATLSDCPQKFYLQNICKITEDDIEELTGIMPDQLNDPKFLREELEVEDEEQEIKLKSYAARGSLIHETMSHAITRNWVVPRSFDEKARKEDLDAVDWGLKELSPFRESHEFISEVPVKFSFFGHMVSGTPDLILKPRELGIAEVWDFKTGQRSEKKESSYWFQLYAYALAIYELNTIDKDEEVKLALSYLDMKSNITKTVNYREVVEYLYKYWKRLDGLDSVNLEHCTRCMFSKICHSNSDGVAPN
jgi:ATP-dependent exoDNAse (exonuclease V) beta subunit